MMIVMLKDKENLELFQPDADRSYAQLLVGGRWYIINHAPTIFHILNMLTFFMALVLLWLCLQMLLHTCN